MRSVGRGTVPYFVHCPLYKKSHRTVQTGAVGVFYDLTCPAPEPG